MAFRREGERTLLDRLAEAGPCRLRLSRSHGPVPEGVIVNTAGGLVSGDRVRVAATLGPGAALTLTSVAAEKVYRSLGPVTEVTTEAVLGEGARLDWLPQETILFDEARLARNLDVTMAGSATATLVEATAFGRQAMGEIVRHGAFTERWRIRRDGRLIFADTIRLEGAIADRLERPALGGGCRAVATLLHLAPDAPARLDEARALLQASVAPCAASAWNGLLLVRWLAPEIGALHRDLARFMTAFRGAALPRAWQT
ncbi:MAG: urease accessory protein UreD [Methylobacteriaceae bacterium]|nr:urease accessory protein UreD [Methylobacteriaceae bacterium]